MIEILPIKHLRDEDAPIFGSLNVALGKLWRLDFPVTPGIVVTPPSFKLRTILEHHNFGSKEIFEQTLTLVKKEIASIPVPDILVKETKGGKKFLVGDRVLNSLTDLWLALLDDWLATIKFRLWNSGFFQGITEGLEPKLAIFLKKLEASGLAFFDSENEDVMVRVENGKVHPADLKKIDELVCDANKKLFIPHVYEWIVDGGVKLAGVRPFTPSIASQLKQYPTPEVYAQSHSGSGSKGSTVKVFLDLSTGLVIEQEVDGIYIASEDIFDLNKPRDSFDGMLFRLIESAMTFPNSPILFKLADKSEGMGKVRGALRLLHQKNLFDPLCEAIIFARSKKGLKNVHIVIPFVRSVTELLHIKRELAVKKLMRKHSLQIWLEVAVPENIVNLEDYLVAGLDGVVLNMDELIAYLNGFDHKEQELLFYKNEVEGLLKFLEDGIRLLHKSKIPFIALGSISLNPKVLDFLVEKGVYGIVIERYEAPSVKDLLHQAERRMILRKDI